VAGDPNLPLDWDSILAVLTTMLETAIPGVTVFIGAKSYDEIAGIQKYPFAMIYGVTDAVTDLNVMNQENETGAVDIAVVDHDKTLTDLVDYGKAFNEQLKANRRLTENVEWTWQQDTVFDDYPDPETRQVSVLVTLAMRKWV
jgi:hypothetical protein